LEGEQSVFGIGDFGTADGSSSFPVIDKIIGEEFYNYSFSNYLSTQAMIVI